MMLKSNNKHITVMKKYSLAFCIVTGLLHAEATTVTQKTKPLPKPVLIAEQYFNQGEYRKALTQAESAYAYYNTPYLHYIWAKSAEALGNREEAMSAYERVLMLQPENSQAKTSLQMIYRETDREDLTQTGDDKPKRNNYRLKLGLSGGYDDNINSYPNDDIVPNPNKSKISSSTFKATANGEYNYKTSSLPQWTFTPKFNLFYQNTPEDHLYDMTMTTISLNSGFKKENFQFKLPVSYNYLHYLNTNLMSKLTLTPTFITSINSTNYLSLQWTFSKTKFIEDTYSDRDSNSAGFKMTYYNQLTPLNLFSIYLSHETHKAEKASTERYINIKYLSLGVSVRHKFSKKISLKSNYRLRESDFIDNVAYDLPSGYYGTNDLREDTMHQVGLNLSYKYDKTLEFYTSAKHTMIDSNYMPADYTKTLWLLGATMHY